MCIVICFNACSDADSIREDQTTMGVTVVGVTAAHGITATVRGTTVAQTTEACTKGLPTGCRSNTSQELRQLKKLLSDMKV